MNLYGKDSRNIWNYGQKTMETQGHHVGGATRWDALGGCGKPIPIMRSEEQECQAYRNVTYQGSRLVTWAENRNMSERGPDMMCESNER